MNYLEIAAEHISRAEGVKKRGDRHMPYRDSRGFLTIGRGRNLDAKGISEEEAEFLFQNDLDPAIEDARALVANFDDHSESRKAALVELAFNMGRETLAGFRKMLAAFVAKRYAEAADELKDSDWFNEVGMRGPRLVLAIREGDAP